MMVLRLPRDDDVRLCRCSPSGSAISGWCTNEVFTRCRCSRPAGQRQRGLGLGFRV